VQVSALLHPDLCRWATRGSAVSTVIGSCACTTAPRIPPTRLPNDFARFCCCCCCRAGVQWLAAAHAPLLQGCSSSLGAGQLECKTVGHWKWLGREGTVLYHTVRACRPQRTRLILICD
jgi:hypothetical protein